MGEGTRKETRSNHKERIGMLACGDVHPHVRIEVGHRGGGVEDFAAHHPLPQEGPEATNRPGHWIASTNQHLIRMATKQGMAHGAGEYYS